MPEKLHVLISRENGRVRSFVLPFTSLKYCTIALAVTLVLSLSGSLHYFNKSQLLSERVADLNAEIQSVASANTDLLEKVGELEYAVREPLTSAVNELNQRSQLMDSILDFVGVNLDDIKIDENDGKRSGGPFFALEDRELPTALLQADQYLKTVSSLPLGFPVKGGVSSRFGRRKDPLNSRQAFHSGIDIMGNSGETVTATADGVVFKAEYDRLNGKYVVINHENGFQTFYGHNRKLLVKKGDKVVRGQGISEVGNTGRSTGTHLHYEVRYKNEAIDPLKYMRVAKYLQDATVVQ